MSGQVKSRMKITARNEMLTFWHKVGFWGAIAGILGFFITIVIFAIAQYSGPTKTNQEVIKKDVSQIVEMLRQEFSIKNEQITFLQGEVARLREVTPSDRARQLAQQIPADAGPYALALKAIAERRFDDARRFLDEAQEQKETELAEICKTRGQTEFLCGESYRGSQARNDSSCVGWQPHPDGFYRNGDGSSPAGHIRGGPSVEMTGREGQIIVLDGAWAIDY